MATLLDLALEYAEGVVDPATNERVFPFGRTVRVFPCIKGGKEPIVKGGFKVASNNPDQIRAWWTRWPYANIGVPMGLNDFVALDVDTKEGKPGLASLQTLIEANEPLPPTLTASTPSGGIHYIFEGEAKNSQSKLGEAIDIRGIGGYIVVEPSRVDNKPYMWTSTVLPAPLPAWIAKALRAIARAEKIAKDELSGKSRKTRDEPVTRGDRRDKLWEYGRSLKDPRAGVKLDDAEVEALMRQYDQDFNKPPYAGSPQADKLEYTIREVLTVDDQVELIDAPPDDAWQGADEATVEQLVEAENAPDPEPLPIPPPELEPEPVPEPILELPRSTPTEYRFESAVPPEHFISEVVEYASTTTDAAYEYHELGALMLLATATPNLIIRVAGASRIQGLGTNLYALVIGRSTTSHKTSSQIAVRDIMRNAPVLADAAMPESMTPEAFLEQLTIRTGKGSIQFVDEFGSLLTKLSKTNYMEGYKSHLLSLYDRSPIKNARRSKKEKDGPVQADTDFVEQSHYSLFGLTTPLIFKTLSLNDLTSGLFARFAIVWPDGKPPFRSLFANDMTANTALFERVSARLDAIARWDSEPTSEERSGNGKPVQFTVDALERITRFDYAQQEMLSKAEEESDLKSLMFARAVPRLAKIAALVTVGRADFLESSPDRVIIQREDVESAIRILARWEEGARRFAQEITESKFVSQVRDCEQIIRQAGKATRRDIMRKTGFQLDEIKRVEAHLGEEGVSRIQVTKIGKSIIWTWIG